MLWVWDMSHFGSQHSTFCNLHMAWCCHPFSLLTELVRPIVGLKVILLLVIGAWPGPCDPHQQKPLVGNEVAALWALPHKYQWHAQPGLSGQGHSHSGKILLGIEEQPVDYPLLIFGITLCTTFIQPSKVP